MLSFETENLLNSLNIPSRDFNATHNNIVQKF